MHKYDGRLIHQSHDDDGIIEVVELNGVRSLHFGSYPRQSSMRIAAPDRLQLAYVRAMTSWLLFKQTLADEALIVGLGGGSLTKHLLHHFPDCRLRVVEYRKSVVRIARSHFGLPLDPRLKIIVDDGGRYILQRTETEREQYSLLFVDAFDHEGMAESICNETFFQACKPLLKKKRHIGHESLGHRQSPVYSSRPMAGPCLSMENFISAGSLQRQYNRFCF